MQGFAPMDDNNTEQWRVIDVAPDYEVSSLGRVRRATDCSRYPAGTIHKGWTDKDGYQRALFRPNGKRIRPPFHQLVCTAFHGPRPSPTHQVAHGDGCRTNNRADNLRWATPLENAADCIKHGNRPRGETWVGGARNTPPLPYEDRYVIRNSPHYKGCIKALADKYGMSPDTVVHYRSKNSKAWADVPYVRQRGLTEEQRAEAIASTETARVIAARYGVSKAHVAQIKAEARQQR